MVCKTLYYNNNNNKIKITHALVFDIDILMLQSQGCKAIPDTPQPIKMSNNAVEIKIIAKPAAKLSEITGKSNIKSL